MDAPSTSGRVDGRKPAQLRAFTCERGVLQRADGSAQWTQGSTVVQAAVYGPRMTFARKEDAERAVVEVTWRPRTCTAGAREKELEHVVCRTLEGAVVLSLHPRTVVQLVLQVVADDGALLSAALNAACAALVDAGVPLRCLFASITCAVRGDVLLLDSCSAEEADADAVASVAYASTSPLPAEGDAAAGEGEQGGGTARKQVCSTGVLSTRCDGALAPADYLRLVSVARRACGQIAAFQRRTLEAAYAPL